MTDASAASERNDAPRDAEPSWRLVLRGFVPLMLLAILLVILVSRHADFLRASSIITLLLATASWMWKLPGDNLLKSVALAIARLLARPTSAVALWGGFAAVLVASFFISSLHVTAVTVPDRPMWLYRVVETSEAPGRGARVDSVLIDHLHLHGDFYMMPSRDRRIWLMTSDYQRTDTMTFYPWRTVTVGYRDQFKPIVAVAFLPQETFLAYIGRGTPLRVRVQDAVSGNTIAADSLTDWHAMPALLLSFAGAPPVDSTTREQWLQLALPDAGDPAAAAGVVKNWSSPHWLRSNRDLKPGDRLSFVMLRANGDTLAHDTLSITGSFSYALVKRRRS